jgi:hypothetical protein
MTDKPFGLGRKRKKMKVGKGRRVGQSHDATERKDIVGSETGKKRVRHP